MYTLTSTTPSPVMTVLIPLFSLGQELDLVQAAPPVILHGRTERPESCLVSMVEAAGSFPALHNEAGRLQHAQVLADRRPRHVELCGDLPRGQLPVPHQLENAQPPGRGDHL